MGVAEGSWVFRVGELRLLELAVLCARQIRGKRVGLDAGQGYVGDTVR